MPLVDASVPVGDWEARRPVRTATGLNPYPPGMSEGTAYWRVHSHRCFAKPVDVPQDRVVCWSTHCLRCGAALASYRISQQEFESRWNQGGAGSAVRP